jgi:hypothetical protein
MGGQQGITIDQSLASPTRAADARGGVHEQISRGVQLAQAGADRGTRQAGRFGHQSLASRAECVGFGLAHRRRLCSSHIGANVMHFSRMVRSISSRWRMLP